MSPGAQAVSGKTLMSVVTVRELILEGQVSRSFEPCGPGWRQRNGSRKMFWWWSSRPLKTPGHHYAECRCKARVCHRKAELDFRPIWDLVENYLIVELLTNSTSVALNELWLVG